MTPPPKVFTRSRRRALRRDSQTKNPMQGVTPAQQAQAEERARALRETVCVIMRARDGEALTRSFDICATRCTDPRCKVPQPHIKVEVSSASSYSLDESWIHYFFTVTEGAVLGPWRCELRGYITGAEEPPEHYQSHPTPPDSEFFGPWAPSVELAMEGFFERGRMLCVPLLDGPLATVGNTFSHTPATKPTDPTN